MTIIAAGVVMFVTPGPGWLVIFAGLGVLATEFVWARRLLRRLRMQERRITASIFGGRRQAPSSANRVQNAASQAVRQ